MIIKKILKHKNNTTQTSDHFNRSSFIPRGSFLTENEKAGNSARGGISGPCTVACPRFRKRVFVFVSFTEVTSRFKPINEKKKKVSKVRSFEVRSHMWCLGMKNECSFPLFFVKLKISTLI